MIFYNTKFLPKNTITSNYRILLIVNKFSKERTDFNILQYKILAKKNYRILSIVNKFSKERSNSYDMYFTIRNSCQKISLHQTVEYFRLQINFRKKEAISLIFYNTKFLPKNIITSNCRILSIVNKFSKERSDSFDIFNTKLLPKKIIEYF